LLAHGWWFSPGTLSSSTTKTGRHDIAEILLKVALNTINQIKSNKSNQTNENNRIACTVKSFHMVTSIKQSLVLKGHFCPILTYKIPYE